MGNIVGEPFPSFVKNQVDSRQKVYGKKDRDVKDLQYLNNRTSWIKLGSSINIDEFSKKYRDLGEEYRDNELAKQLVLFGGSQNDIGGAVDLNSNINRSGRDSLSTAYGFGGLEFGQVPMPGIQSVETKTLNRGSIKRANVTIVAHNPKQFELIEILYLRLGYHVLLEYGHSSYLDDDGELQTQPPTLMSKFLDGEFSTPYQVLDAIQSQKVTTRGNYDALLGKVDKFFWEFNPDGTYKISLSLVSIGDVIQSLNLNTTKSFNKDTDEPIELNYRGNELAKQFKSRISELKRVNTVQGKENQTSVLTSKLPNGSKIVTYKKHSFSGEKGTTTITNRFYYIRFDEFLRVLEKNLVFTLDLNNKIPALKFDTDIASNLMYYDPNVFTLDPRICVADYELPFSDETRYLFNQHLQFDAFEEKNFKAEIGETSYGRIMNIFLEMNFILDVLEKNVDENGKVPLLNFLKSILKEVNNNFSNSTELDVFLDETTNKVKILEQRSLPNLESILKQFELPNSNTIFDIYGYSSNQTSGFVKTFNFKTEISNALSTTISIGAQSSGTIKGENFSAFSNWNRGLIDRISPVKSNPLSSKNSLSLDDIKNQISSKEEELNKTKITFLGELLGYSSPGIPSFKPTSVNSFLDLQRDCYELAEEIVNLKQQQRILEGNQEGKTNEKVFSNSIAFLPLNLSLTLDGLSGFKIYQSFLLRQGLLPKNYPDNLRFLIKGVSNTINSEGWTTTIETLSQPTFTKTPKQLIFGDKLPSTDFVVLARLSDIIEEQIETPNADILRETLQKLGYSEKIGSSDGTDPGPQISSGGDITSNMEKVASAVLTTLKQKLPNLSIEVTGGNDLFHQKLQDSKSRHKKGNGLDFVISPNNLSNVEKVESILQGYSGGSTSELPIRYLNEYATKSKNATGNHFHLSVGAGTEGRKEFFLAKREIRKGKIEKFVV